jgi:hypothetical protein
MLNNNKAEIKWTTSAEINVSHFVIERSMDGINYKDAGVVFAYGSKVDKTNYSFSDNLDNQQPGIFYYRLVTIDADGKSLFSLTRIVKVGKQTDNNISIVTFPNPVSNKLQISIPARWKNNKVVYEMYNTNGQNVIIAESITGNQTRILNVNSLAPGLYIIRLSCNGQMAQQKIIKQ